MRTDEVAAIVHEADVLQDKAPMVVEALLEAQSHQSGLRMRNIDAMITVLSVSFTSNLTVCWKCPPLQQVLDTDLSRYRTAQDVLLAYIAHSSDLDS